MSNLNKEELELLESVENGEWQSVENVQSEINRYQRIAQKQFTDSIYIELSPQEHLSLEQLASHSDQSTSSFVQEILRKFLSGQLVETNS